MAKRPCKIPVETNGKNMSKPDLQKLAHDLRNPVHSALLNLEAAQMLAAKWQDPKGQRLARHLGIIAADLQKLKTLVAEAASQMKNQD